MPSPAASPDTALRFTGARFRHAWRPYQARILQTLDGHLHDDHLHVVAPPGSGKTVLGLEALRRLGRPALVLAPTLTIREQWIARLLGDFVVDDPAALQASLSRDAAQPGEISLLTYQGLYSLFHRGQEAAVIAALRARGVGVLVVDEAHHLRAEWWRCLDRLKQAQPGVQVLALTATPPFDAPEREWRRYRAFCGEVDEEIGVPELVGDGNLCPHQDLLVLFAPDPPAAAELQRFARDSRALLADLALDAEMAALCAALPAVREPQQHVELLSQHPHFWLAVLVYLGGQRWEAVQALSAALGLDGLRLPAFDSRWAERLLHSLLVERLVVAESHGCLAAWRERLQAMGALQRGRIQLGQHPHLQPLLDRGSGMLDATVEIVQAEAANFGPRLRMVVLSDHVRAEAFVRPGEASHAASRVGVVPLFERIRRLHFGQAQLAVLCGRLVVLPRALLPDWQAALAAEGIDAAASAGTPLWQDSTFVRIDLDARLRAVAVPTLTALFERGGITVLCGTVALLGEGWDAPAVNSLVLATAVSAHVSSNQLRGRGIRARPSHPHKAANLWHLAGVEIGEPLDEPPAAMLARFRGFLGLHATEDRIESGLQRLGDCQRRLSREQLVEWNRRSFVQAAQVEGLHTRWRRAIGEVRPGEARLRRVLRLPMAPLLPPLSLQRRDLSWLPGLRWLQRWLARRELQGVARCVALALVDAGIVPAGAVPVVEADADGSLRVRLDGSDYLPQARYIEALAQVFDPLHAPRYLILRGQRGYALPQACARRKADAAAFLRHWRRQVGRGELIATRTPEGRLCLLRLREQLLARFPDWQVEHRAQWQRG
jgi:superfamily II DNA or RNA helicase